MPFVFSGPDPWVEMDEVPAAMPDEALAFVYTAGEEIRWVFLRIVDSENGWSEDVNYFFRTDGTIAKRMRELHSNRANIVLQVITYYERRRVLKESSHYRAFGPGPKHPSEFDDPDAPVFWNVDELPFPEIPDLWRRLA
ncbi:MAG: hypothetical protein JOZ22_22860 [Acidobacteriia bacterium]|nr:hypothetical protein [Terriglobia bacterium]